MITAQKAPQPCLAHELLVRDMPNLGVLSMPCESMEDAADLPELDDQGLLVLKTDRPCLEVQPR
jgi:hypothetical protein